MYEDETNFKHACVNSSPRCTLYLQGENCGENQFDTRSTYMENVSVCRIYNQKQDVCFYV